MASFEDYDEFGNYIGADLDSDDEEELPQNQFLQQQPQVEPLEGFDDEPMPGPGADEGALMEVDGSYLTPTHTFLSRLAGPRVFLL
jgi:116 kDa U5 small nuclear ribonucleoprotein component